MMLIADALITSLLWLLNFVIWLEAEPFQRGFFCSDDSLRYPYKKSTISVEVLYMVGLVLPVMTISIVELIRHGSGQKPTPGAYPSIDSESLRSFLKSTLHFVVVFSFGAGVNELVTCVLKYSTGRLRPHFFDVCNPTVPCSKESHHTQYVDEYECQSNHTEYVLLESRLSFPSGHATVAAYVATFLVMYVEERLDVQDVSLLKPLVQLVFTVAALYTGISRITDHKHHESDVLCGFLLGCVTAAVIYRYILPSPRISSEMEGDGGRSGRSFSSCDDQQ